MRILDEINDIEVIWLRYYGEPTMGGDEDFQKRQAEVLRPAVAALNSSRDEYDKQTLQESYQDHLAQLNILTRRYENGPQNKATGVRQLERQAKGPGI